MSLQPSRANKQLSDTSRQIELLTEQIHIMNQRQFGQKSESNLSEMVKQVTIFDPFNEAKVLFNTGIKEPLGVNTV